MKTGVIEYSWKIHDDMAHTHTHRYIPLKLYINYMRDAYLIKHHGGKLRSFMKQINRCAYTLCLGVSWCAPWRSQNIVRHCCDAIHIFAPSVLEQHKMIYVQYVYDISYTSYAARRSLYQQRWISPQISTVHTCRVIKWLCASISILVDSNFIYYCPLWSCQCNTMAFFMVSNSNYWEYLQIKTFCAPKVIQNISQQLDYFPSTILDLIIGL